MNCAGLIHGVNGGVSQRVTCFIVNNCRETMISSDVAAAAGLDMVPLQRDVGLVDMGFGGQTRANSLARNVCFSLLDTEGNWVEYTQPVVLCPPASQDPRKVFLGDSFLRGPFGGWCTLPHNPLSNEEPPRGIRAGLPLLPDGGRHFFDTDPGFETPNGLAFGPMIMQWPQGTRPKTCSVCEIEFPGLKTCARCVEEDTPKRERPRYCSKACQRADWRGGHREFHQTRNAAIDAAP